MKREANRESLIAEAFSLIMEMTDEQLKAVFEMMGQNGEYASKDRGPDYLPR